MHLVGELLDDARRTGLPVLDPFSGTGTTALACAERGLDALATDVNPFLVWLGTVKTARYSDADRDGAVELVLRMSTAARRGTRRRWVPALHDIERWWDDETLAALSRAFAMLRSSEATRRATDLAKLAFCRALIDVASVSFGHQSMSFRRARPVAGAAGTARVLSEAVESITQAARGGIERGRRTFLLGDARHLDRALGARRIGALITSPPYANRMSYVRELRPYMYWLGHLAEPRDAGALDWQAIGGTWGMATSQVARWTPERAAPPRSSKLSRMLRRIRSESDVLSRYVEKYCHDMALHTESAARVLAPGAAAHYVIGNSKFFDVLVPVERILAEQLECAGLVDVRVRKLRKRTSKRELWEFLVSARKPGRSP